ncbi:hypothetical protein Poli38472_007858 [Pythium oligandrum]|uniref:Hexose transporter 1 n=1 Tax=Pythium oligandrum TaxID=41045 RepID=A0A8K1CT74_PYTOL|nr:hypothetical protein Poli38472_007858 [Pythium oligandrum]|eukprot:TMW68186.1 hypothetical protein Poli38472_007858 [Pythium oligandrum]
MTVSTPTAASPTVAFEGIESPAAQAQPMTPPVQTKDGDDASLYGVLRVNSILYACVALVLLQPVQFGWSVSQLNLSTFNNEADCNARPVRPGTCLMFPGHTKGEWMWVVNTWIVGGMIGSLSSGQVSDRLGRKKAMMITAVLMIVGAVIMAASSTIPVFAVGRFVAGLASGASTAIPSGYINEISPPHLRNRLGTTFQVAVGVGIILVGCTYFFANTSSGWRYIGGFPIILGSAFLLGAMSFLIESPAWLLTKGRQEEAEHELARLFGEENVKVALSWLSSARDQSVELEHGENNQDETSSEGSIGEENPWKMLFSPDYRMQTLVAIVVALSQQLTGINAVFFYSSSFFKDAGLDDDRIGSIIVNIVNVLPTLFAGALSTRFGNRKMMIVGHGIMLAAAVGMTVALLVESAVVSIVFTAIYVAGFAVSLGPLVFVIISAVFPSSLRATGASICLFANWCGTLAVGIGYPYVADALEDLGFLPFIVLLAVFGLFMIKFLPETAGKTDDEILAIFRSKRKAKALE